MNFKIKSRREWLFEEGRDIHFKMKSILSGVVQNEGLSDMDFIQWKKDVKAISIEAQHHFGNMQEYLEEVTSTDIKFRCESCGHWTKLSTAYRDPTDENGVYETYKCEKCGFEDLVDNCVVGKVEE